MIIQFKNSCLCELINVKNQQNEFSQVKHLKEIKIAISQEATRFSGHQQHVRYIVCFIYQNLLILWFYFHF
jgi:hypothetical protein